MTKIGIEKARALENIFVARAALLCAKTSYLPEGRLGEAAKELLEGLGRAEAEVRGLGEEVTVESLKKVAAKVGKGLWFEAELPGIIGA